MAFSPDVPAKVPADVPAETPLPDPSQAPTAKAARKPKYLTRTPDGWRFQMRLPVSQLPDSFLARSAPIIRASLGPMGDRNAGIVSQQLATLCRTVVGMARHMELPLDAEELLNAIERGCAAGIREVRKHPENAMALAHGLRAAHDALTLVANETAKGSAGMAAIVRNAPTLVQDSISRVLALAGVPVDAAAVDAESLLSTIDRAAWLTPLPLAPPLPTPALATGCPTFGQVSANYIEMRRAIGIAKGEADTLVLRRKTFLDVIGDKPVDTYIPSDLQRYVNAMQGWPVDANKRLGDAAEWDTKDIIEANRDRSQPPMSLKTIQDGYVANIKTMMRYEMVEKAYRDPFAGARIRWPKGYAPSKPREGLDTDVLNRAFELGCASGQMDEAMLPLMALLTGRRLGLLLYLRGSDIRDKHGVAVAQTAGILLTNGIWQRVPICSATTMMAGADNQLGRWV